MKIVQSSSSILSLSIIFLSWLILFNPILSVSADCTCEPDEETDSNKTEAMKYKIGAIASILVAGAIGVSIPLLGKVIPALRPDKDIFLVIKVFAAGVILATGFIYILPDAFNDLTSPCLKENPWGNFPFTGFIAMMSSLLTLMIDSIATGCFVRSHVHFNKSIPINGSDEEQRSAVANQHMHGHSHGSSAMVVPEGDSSPANDLVRFRVISQVLELGIIVHSVVIGVALGASQSPSTIKPLVAALTFHQFFEGLGLGGTIAQAKFKSRSIITMSLFFALTVPIGVGVGIGISNVYSEISPTALIVQGTLNAAAAGILIYMSLVDLLAADFMSIRMQTNPKLQIISYSSLFLGAGLMSLLAKWA